MVLIKHLQMSTPGLGLDLTQPADDTLHLLPHHAAWTLAICPDNAEHVPGVTHEIENMRSGRLINFHQQHSSDAQRTRLHDANVLWLLRLLAKMALMDELQAFRVSSVLVQTAPADIMR